jgi:hypothetical protein
LAQPIALLEHCPCIAIGDGSSRFVSQTMALAVQGMLAVKNDGLPLSEVP